MKVLDIILLIVLAIGAYRGYTKGLLQTIMFFIALIAAVLGGFKLLDMAIKFLAPYFGGFSELLPYIAFMLLFVGIIIGVTLLGKVLKKMLDITLLGSVDNLAGALLGAAQWAFGASVVCWLSLQAGGIIPLSAREGTWLFPLIVDFAPGVAEACSGILPFLRELFGTIQDSFKESVS